MTHSVLERQIKKFLGNVNIDTFPQQWRDLLKVISDTYTHYEEDRALMERSLDISSKELTKSNQKLRVDIQHLNSKSDDLNQMNTMMVDRELRMVELKKTIKELEAKLMEEKK